MTGLFISPRIKTSAIAQIKNRNFLISFLPNMFMIDILNLQLTHLEFKSIIFSLSFLLSFFLFFFSFFFFFLSFSLSFFLKTQVQSTQKAINLILCEWMFLKMIMLRQKERIAGILKLKRNKNLRLNNITQKSIFQLKKLNNSN